MKNCDNEQDELYIDLAKLFSELKVVLRCRMVASLLSTIRLISEIQNR